MVLFINLNTFIAPSRHWWHRANFLSPPASSLTLSLPSLYPHINTITTPSTLSITSSPFLSSSGWSACLSDLHRRHFFCHGVDSFLIKMAVRHKRCQKYACFSESNGLLWSLFPLLASPIDAGAFSVWTDDSETKKKPISYRMSGPKPWGRHKPPEAVQFYFVLRCLF